MIGEFDDEACNDEADEVDMVVIIACSFARAS